jgi:DNA-binding transcriptional MerR regulator
MTEFIFYDNPTLTLACVPADSPVLFSLEAAASLTGVHPEMLQYYCRAGLIDGLHGLSTTDLCFEESALEEVRRIEHYRRHLAVGRQALPLVCDLRREADRRHIEIGFLEVP